MVAWLFERFQFLADIGATSVMSNNLQHQLCHSKGKCQAVISAVEGI